MQKITLDIDQYKIYRKTDHIDEIVKKIASLPCSISLETEPSASTNGFHVTVHCNKNKCDICRMVYDDTNRFRYDTLLRQPHEQNILFTSYTIIKNKHTLQFSK